MISTIFSLHALLGGLLIGVSASIFLLFLGRIMGVSGILSNLMTVKGISVWRIAFILGLLLSPWLFSLITELPTIEISGNLWLLIIGGLFVGFGAAMSSGCTSGHSICGISRLSLSSIFVTVIFMIAGGIAVFVVKHLIYGV